MNKFIKNKSILIPEVVLWNVFFNWCWHPLTASQTSLVHSGEHQPPHLGPNRPGGQDFLQRFPKYPGVQSAKCSFYDFLESSKLDIFFHMLNAI